MLGLSGLSYRFRKWLISRVHERDRSNNGNDYVFIDEVINRFRTAGGLKHDFQGYKLRQLIHVLEVYRPRSVLELGSGSSTAIFANYIRRTSNGRLVSVDESRQWLNNARNLAEVDAADGRFVWMEAKTKICDRLGVPSIEYDVALNESFDLVFIDGPSLRIDNAKRKDAMNGNVLDLLEEHPPKVIVVDGRYTTVKALASHTKGLYSYFPSELLERFPKYGYQYFSIFVLKN